MATFTVQESSLGGQALTFNAVNGGGDDFTNDGRTYIIAKNDNGSTARTFDIVTTQTITGQTLAVDDLSISVAASTQELIGPFSNTVFSGTVSISNYSSTSDLTIAVFKVS